MLSERFGHIFSFALILCVALCVLLGGLLFYFTFSKEDSPKEYVITLTDSGFSPNEITLKEGDTLRFRTERNRPFWPASDLHPTHTIYPGFDSRFPIHPEMEWSFTFTQPGRWRYHDHLDPQHLGLVIVQSKGDSLPVQDVADCSTLEGPQKLQCFDQTLESRLRDSGIESAFAYFLDIYRADPEVPEVCHAWAHRLGEVEYGLYTEGKEVQLRPEASLCSYGYFHGFINAMVKESGDFKKAQEFCTQATAARRDSLQGLESHCIHGIGHSIATLALEGEEYNTNLVSLAQAGAQICEDLYMDSESLCIDGLLHELYLSMERGDYGLNSDRYLNSGDIFFYCHGLLGALEEACYYESVTLWEHFIGSDKKEVMLTILDSTSALLERSPRVLHTLARSFIESDIASGDFEGSVEACAAVPEEYFSECMRGLALGFATHGDPGNLHAAGFAFCESYYEGGTQSLCFEKMVDELYLNYGAQAVRNACAELGPAKRPSACTTQ